MSYLSTLVLCCISGSGDPYGLPLEGGELCVVHLSTQWDTRSLHNFHRHQQSGSWVDLEDRRNKRRRQRIFRPEWQISKALQKPFETIDLFASWGDISYDRVESYESPPLLWVVLARAPPLKCA